jgi:hypothetical protein
VGSERYGFEPYIATTPGSAVLVLARFWADNAATTLAEERFPAQCLTASRPVQAKPWSPFRSQTTSDSQPSTGWLT